MVILEQKFYQRRNKMASPEKENMADQDLKINPVPNIPATNLRYTTVHNISMDLCIEGTLKNWKHLADKLGFKNIEINGHFANFSGCASAENMLNEWIFKRGGSIPELVKVFKELGLESCLQELLADEDYQAACKFFCKKSHGGNDNDDDDDDNDDDGVSSGSSSISEDTSFPPSSTTDSMTTNSICDNSTLKNSSPQPPLLEKHSPKHEGQQTVSNEEHESKEHLPKKDSKRSKSVDSINKENSQNIIMYTDWPKPDLTRSISEPGVPEKNKMNGKKTLFTRSISESGKNRDGGRKTKQSKSTKSWLGLRIKIPKRKKKRALLNEVVTAQGHYVENKPREMTNFSPLTEAEIPASVDETDKGVRPVSTSSEDSIPFSPSSPNSLGYESGQEIDSSENKDKKLYIICNPSETEIFEKAYDLYICFCKKGYNCTMFMFNANEVLEIGVYRYNMEQVNNADYLFLCVSKELKTIFEEPSKNLRRFRDDNSKGLRHVSDFMMSFLATKCCNKNGKIMPILLGTDSDEHIPQFLGNYSSYQWPEQEAKMENTIHRRSEIFIPVSSRREQASQKVFGLKPV